MMIYPLRMVMMISRAKKNNESWRLPWSPTESGLGVCPGGPNPEALPLGCATTTQVVAGRVTT